MTDYKFGWEADTAPQAKTAWNTFYHTGKIEDYIRYAQMKNSLRGEGETNVGEDTGIDH